MTRDTFVLWGAFDDMRLPDFRLLDEAAMRGVLHIDLWSDDAILTATGKPPKFPVAERKYLLESIRFVDTVKVTDDPKHQPSLDDKKMIEDIYQGMGMPIPK